MFQTCSTEDTRGLGAGRKVRTRQIQDYPSLSQRMISPFCECWFLRETLGRSVLMHVFYLPLPLYLRLALSVSLSPARSFCVCMYVCMYMTVFRERLKWSRSDELQAASVGGRGGRREGGVTKGTEGGCIHADDGGGDCSGSDSASSDNNTDDHKGDDDDGDCDVLNLECSGVYATTNDQHDQQQQQQQQQQRQTLALSSSTRTESREIDEMF